jgi:hypothetical protein
MGATLCPHGRGDVWVGGIEPSVRFFAAAARALVSCRQAGAALGLLEEMKCRHQQPNLEIYVLIIEGLAFQRRPHAAFQVLSQMVQGGDPVKPSPRAIRAVVHGCVAGCSYLGEGDVRWRELVNSCWDTVQMARRFGIWLPPDSLHPVLHLLVRDLSLAALATKLSPAAGGAGGRGRSGVREAAAQGDAPLDGEDGAEGGGDVDAARLKGLVERVTMVLSEMQRLQVDM